MAVMVGRKSRKGASALAGRKAGRCEIWRGDAKLEREEDGSMAGARKSDASRI